MGFITKLEQELEDEGYNETTIIIKLNKENRKHIQLLRFLRKQEQKLGFEVYIGDKDIPQRLGMKSVLEMPNIEKKEEKKGWFLRWFE